MKMEQLIPDHATPDRIMRDMTTVLSCPAQIEEACAHLARQDKALSALITRVGPPRLALSLEQSPFEALIRAIAHQQLHARAAEAILARFQALFPVNTDFPSPLEIMALDTETLRQCGFSGTKIIALRGVCEAAQGGIIPDRSGCTALDDETLIQRLTTLRGIGRWTVEMLMIFTLGRTDILPVDDFGVREGWRLIKGLESQPRPKILADIGQSWSPWRSLAAWYLWRAADEAKKIPRPPPSEPATSRERLLRAKP
ncbi:DNA-3-methyladenine glycosylase II [Granulibacter bethesdensis]|uniref:DNA-3-methyladenine glycosylase II n=2 Tax=Granulibacter bethesdensis TaxID=364410 RepID=A0AAN0RE16_9PROT|nr:DNA-3-methyladenine glycosylase II [Granulibacter bethesdensis]